MRKLRCLAALLLAGAAAPAAATECAATVESNDAMQFTTRELVVPRTCGSFSVTLRHTGKLPATAMGHNFVLARAADVPAVAADGAKAGVASGYVKPGDARVIAASRVIGGGESTRVDIPVQRLRAGEAYAYICSFPGHFVIMRGSLRLAE